MYYIIISSSEITMIIAHYNWHKINIFYCESCEFSVMLVLVITEYSEGLNDFE